MIDFLDYFFLFKIFKFSSMYELYTISHDGVQFFNYQIRCYGFRLLTGFIIEYVKISKYKQASNINIVNK